MSSLFPSKTIKILTDSDFTLDEDEKITMKNKSLNVVLFHTNNDLSKSMVKIWKELVEEVTGPHFCVCDLTIQTQIADKITEVSLDETSPYHRFASHKPPFILVYRNGRPQKDYKDALTHHKLTLFTSGLIDNYSNEANHKNNHKKSKKEDDDSNEEDEEDDDDEIPKVTKSKHK